MLPSDRRLACARQALKSLGLERPVHHLRMGGVEPSSLNSISATSKRTSVLQESTASARRFEHVKNLGGDELIQTIGTIVFFCLLRQALLRLKLISSFAAVKLLTNN